MPHKLPPLPKNYSPSSNQQNINSNLQMKTATIYQVFQVYTPLSLVFLEFEHVHDLLCFASTPIIVKFAYQAIILELQYVIKNIMLPTKWLNACHTMVQKNKQLYHIYLQQPKPQPTIQKLNLFVQYIWLHSHSSKWYTQGFATSTRFLGRRNNLIRVVPIDTTREKSSKVLGNHANYGNKNQARMHLTHSNGMAEWLIKSIKHQAQLDDHQGPQNMFQIVIHNWKM